jgi:hypothetical protein
MSIKIENILKIKNKFGFHRNKLNSEILELIFIIYKINTNICRSTVIGITQ